MLNYTWSHKYYWKGYFLGTYALYGYTYFVLVPSTYYSK